MDMDVSNKLNNYQSGAQTVSKAPTAVRNASVKRIASSLNELKKGQVFEGNISSVRGSQVSIKLITGETLKANIDPRSGVQLREGENMFFQVRSSDSSRIEIRPFTVNGEPMNPILYKALQSAGLSTNGDYIKMVDEMMKEGLSIDRNSLVAMSRVVSANSGQDISSIVQMTKLGISVNEANLTQFENYKNNEAGLLKSMDDIAGGIEQWMSSSDNPKELVAMNKTLTAFVAFGTDNVINAGAAQNAAVRDASPLFPDFAASDADDMMVNTLSAEDEKLFAAFAQEENATTIGSVLGEAINELSAKLSTISTFSGSELPAGLFTSGEGAVPEGANEAAQPGELSAGPQLNPELSPKEFLQKLDAFMSQIDLNTMTSESTPSPVDPMSVLTKDTVQLISSGILGEQAEEALAKGTITQDQAKVLNSVTEELLEEFNPETTRFAAKARQTVAQMFENTQGAGQEGRNISELVRDSIRDVFSGKEFQNILKEALMNKWTLTPESVGKEGSIEKFYNELQKQMEQVSKLFSGIDHPGAQMAAKAATSTLDNLNMMNEINQIYNYVQLPLSMSGGRANGELFVYTNKRSLADKDGQLSCMLHLDMEYLGTTDVYVKMRGNKVDTDFALSDDISFRLIRDNIGILQKRLEKIGYDVTINLKEDIKEQDFVKDFLMQEDHSERVKRYSFDVKA